MPISSSTVKEVTRKQLDVKSVYRWSLSDQVLEEIKEMRLSSLNFPLFTQTTPRGEIQCVDKQGELRTLTNPVRNSARSTNNNP